MRENKTFRNDNEASDPTDQSGSVGSPRTGAVLTPSVVKALPKDVASRRAAGVIESEPEPAVNKMRRRIVWASVTGFLVTSFLMFLRFFLPRAIFEPSSIIRIGFPDEYGIGIDEKYKMKHRIWVDRTSDRLFVIFARCTHLGCTPDWKPSENKFKCPCHGSGYDIEGINFEGPAPRPMDRCRVELDAEGQIVVDASKLYQQPKGERTEFDDPGAFFQI